MPEGGHFTPEQIEQGKKVTEYYQNLDENDPANWPDDDETKTQLPFHAQIKEAKHDQASDQD